MEIQETQFITPLPVAGRRGRRCLVRATAAEVDNLRELMAAADPVASRRAAVILLTLDGWLGDQVGAVTGMARSTVKELKMAWVRQGLASLHHKPMGRRAA